MEYDYDAVHDDELTIRVGEIIRNVKKLEEEGWLEGELNGRRGMFPDNFVKVSFLPRLLLWSCCGLVITEMVQLHASSIFKGINFLFEDLLAYSGSLGCFWKFFFFSPL